MQNPGYRMLTSMQTRTNAECCARFQDVDKMKPAPKHG